jgi:transcription elongation factor Elf1
MIVTPKRAKGMNMSWNLNLFSGPKWYIECGNCGCGFEARIPRVNHPVISCTNCGTGNELPIEWT